MSEKPKSALDAMLARVIAHSEALHEELHEFDDDLSHHVSHLLKKIAKLTAYAELEVSDRRSPEAVSLITRNMAEINVDLTDLLEDSSTDPAIYAVGEAISKLVAMMQREWDSSTSNHAPATKEEEDPRDTMLIFERLLEKMIPTARADIAVRHAFLALRELAKFWRADDDHLVPLVHGHDHECGHDHEHEHGHHHEGNPEEGHPHHEEI